MIEYRKWIDYQVYNNWVWDNRIWGINRLLGMWLDKKRNN